MEANKKVPFFRRYDDIENTYREELIEKIRQLEYQGEWVVEEKIHGANFSFWIDQEEIKVAKRSSFLNEEELRKFYRCNKVVQAHQDHCQRLFQVVTDWAERGELGKVLLVVVYGELFGGWYPHPEVPKVPDVVPLQKEIFYSPDLGFCAFDVLIRKEDGNKVFLDVDSRNTVLQQAGFLESRSLFRGTLDECLQHPNAFPTTIPRRLGLPEIEGNVCEGVVIRPVEPLYFPRGGRVILKNKNEKFSERTKKKRKRGSQEGKMAWTSEQQELLQKLLEYHVRARFMSVMSKYGMIDENANIHRLLGEYVQDLMKDFAKDQGTVLKDLNKNARKQLSRALFKAVLTDFMKWIEEIKQS